MTLVLYKLSFCGQFWRASRKPVSSLPKLAAGTFWSIPTNKTTSHGTSMGNIGTLYMLKLCSVTILVLLQTSALPLLIAYSE